MQPALRLGRIGFLNAVRQFHTYSSVQYARSILDLKTHHVQHAVVNPTAVAHKQRTSQHHKATFFEAESEFFKVEYPSQKLMFKNWPLENILVICKLGDSVCADFAYRSIKFLREKYPQQHFNFIVESSFLKNTQQMEDESLYSFDTNSTDHILQIWQKVDLVICFGGDGTILHLHSIFTNSPYEIPPVLGFRVGKSLGFLLAHDADNYQSALARVMDGHALGTVRMRLECEVMRKNESIFKAKVLNEMFIHRGDSLSSLIVKSYVNNFYCTTSKGDGMIIATPTGSTGYNLSGGGSMVHPMSHCILLTPICPNNFLSFQPTILPSVAEVKLEIAEESRIGGTVSFDSLENIRVRLHKGDQLIIRKSPQSLITINNQDSIVDWMNSIHQRLKNSGLYQYQINSEDDETK